MRASRTVLSMAIIVAMAFPPSLPVRAEEEHDRSRSPYEIDLGLDLGISAGSLVVFGLPRLLADESVQPWCGLECDPDDVNGLDRYVIGKHSEAAQAVSDAGALTSHALPLVLGAIDVLASDPADGWAGYGKDMLVLVETFAVSTALSSLLKYAVRRPRPLVYDSGWSDDERLRSDSAMSFPSGHTSSAFAMATAYSYTFTMRHPNSPLKVPVWLGTYAVAGLTGVMRTEAGKHFWTDVIAGAALGVGVGLLVPWLHLRDEGPGEDGSPPAIDVTVSPVVTPGWVGAALTFR